MDLRYHAGGEAIQTWTPVVETINAKMEFFAMDAEVEAGHVLRLTLRSTGEDYLTSEHIIGCVYSGRSNFNPSTGHL